MRNFTRSLLSFALVTVLLSGLLFISSCGDDETPPPDPAADRLAELAIKTWALQSATRNSVAITEFDGMSLSVSENRTYSVSGGDFAPVWPASGDFDFGGTADNPDVNTIVRSDGVSVSITGITDTSLTLEFTFTSPTTRTTGVDGDYEFVFN